MIRTIACHCPFNDLKINEYEWIIRKKEKKEEIVWIKLIWAEILNIYECCILF